MGYLINPYAFGPGAQGANLLLVGETQGFAIDATSYDTITAAAYTGGPVGGTVSVIDTGTPANDKDNVALDNSNLTQSSSSPKMVQFPSSPVARWTPHNLILQSQDLATTWTNNNSTETTNSTVAPDGTTTGDTLAQATSTTDCYITQSYTAVSGFVYCFSVYVKASGTATDWVRLYLTDGTDSAGKYFDLTNGVAGSSTSSTWTVAASGIESAGNGWYRCYVATTVDNTTVSVRVELAEADNDSNVQASDAVIVWGAQVNHGYTPTPYLATTTTVRYGIPQGYDTAGSRYGILVEIEATNRCLYSDNFTNAAWTKSNMTTAKTATGPDNGSNSASTLTATAANATALQAITSASSSRISGFWVKRRTGTGNIDLTQDNGTNWTTVTVTADWTRVELAAATLTDPTVGIRIVTSGDAVDVFGFQHETGAVLTSTIPTLGSTRTRNGDAMNTTTSTYPHSDTEGTIVVWVRSQKIDHTTDTRVTTLHDGTKNETMEFGASVTGSPDSFNFDIYDNNAIVASPNAGTFSLSGNKVAVFYKANDSGILADGGTQVVDTSCTMPTVTKLQIGYDSNFAGREFTGFVYQFRYLPRRMTEAQMQTATS